MNLDGVGGLFDTITGLPVHPLVVHFAVVLLPLSAIALVVIVLMPRWRATFGWVVLGGLVVGTGAAFVATQSGEALAEHVGTPQRHAQLGEATEKVALVLLVVALGWFLLSRRRGSGASAPARRLGQGLELVAAVATIVLALATIGLTIAVGHSGAQAVWAGRVTTPTPSATASGSPTATTSPSSTAATAAATSSPTATPLTMADVQAHDTASDCWTVVDGTVYDLTTWIARHPGGPRVIENMCGTDATTAFRAQHGTTGSPNQTLDGFAVGPLG